MTAVLVVAYEVADAGELRAIAYAACQDDAVAACATSAAVDAGSPFAGLVEVAFPSSGVNALVDRLGAGRRRRRGLHGPHPHDGGVDERDRLALTTDHLSFRL